MEAVLPENARTYFLERDSAAFRSLLAKVLKLGTMEMTETWREGESTFVRLVTRPDFGSWVPKSVQGQANGKSIEFHDVLEYRPELIEREPFQINVKTESPFLGNKLDVQLKLIIEAVDENTCRQVLAGSIKVNMFGVGRIVEGIVKDSLQNTYKKLPEIVKRWQAFRQEALLNGNAEELLSGRPPVGNSVAWIRQEVLNVMQSPIEEEACVPPGSPTSSTAPSVSAATHHHHQQQQQPMARLRSSRTEYFDASDTLGGEDPPGTSGGSSQLAPPGRQLRIVPPPEEADLASSSRGPGSPFQKQPSSQRAWHGFNHQYEEWTAYWDSMGVKHMAPKVLPSGPLSFLYRAEEAVRETASTAMFSLYMFALRKGMVTVEPDADGRYAGKAPRLATDPPAAALRRGGGGGGTVDEGGGLQGRVLYRHPSAPSSSFWQQGEGVRAVADEEGLLSEEEGRRRSDTSAYGTTDQADALLASVTMRRTPPHRRAISLDAATAASARQHAAAVGQHAPHVRGGGATQAPGQEPSARRTIAPGGTTLATLGEEEGVRSPRFSCVPVCWGPRHGKSRQERA